MELTSLRPRMLALLLVVLTVAVYLPAIGAGFIWDDDTLLTANPQMRSLDGLGQIWRGEQSRDYTPLTLSSFWVEWRLWGDRPAGYHVVNILLHALSAVLLWRILERLRVPGAWLGALLFAIHPVNVASVAWVAERKNTLSAALFLGSVLCYLAGRDEKRRGLYTGSIGLFLLAALSKGAVVTMPAVLLLCVAWKDRRLSWRDVWEVMPFGAIAVACSALTILFQARAPHYGLIPDTVDYRVARAGAAVWFYLGALVWPAGMSPMRAPWVPNLRSASTYVPALGAAAVWGLFFWKRKTWGRAPLFGYTYYLIMLAPVLGFVWMTLMQETPSADWWQYMAAPGVFACVAGTFVIAGRKWRAAMPLFAVVVAALIFQTWRRAGIYESMGSYCLAVTAEDPHAWTLQNNLGILLKQRGHYPEAEACFHRALEDNPGYIEAHVNLGNALGAAGDARGAEMELRRAGLMYEGKGWFAQAEGCFRDALEVLPGDIAMRIKLCEVLLEEGNTQAALRSCAEVEALARKIRDPGANDAAAKLRQECEAATAPR
jgi:tetratricopeptide (TPR) repeat protein